MVNQRLKILFRRCNQNSWLRWSLSGLLIGLAFTYSSLWWISVIGLVVFIDAIFKAGSFKEIILGSLLVGLIRFLIVLSWFWSVYPLDWLGVGVVESLALVFGVWFTCSVVFGLGVLFPAVIAFILKKKELTC